MWPRLTYLDEPRYLARMPAPSVRDIVSRQGCPREQGLVVSDWLVDRFGAFPAPSIASKETMGEV